MPEGSASKEQVSMSVEEGIRLAVEFHQRGRIEEAESLYKRVLEQFPDQVDALHFLGILRNHQRRPEEAISLIRRALELAPDYVDARNNLGNIYRQAGDLDAAEVEYERVLAQAPRHADAWNNFGTVRHRRGDPEGAVAAYLKAIESQPRHSGAWLNLGNERRRAGEFEAAREAYQAALELEPGSALVHMNLGRILYRLGRTEEAMEIYRRWVEFDPGNPVAQHMLAAAGGADTPDRAGDDFVRRTFDAFSADFDDTLTRLKYQAPALVTDALATLCEEAPREDFVILDAGCGTGLCGPLLRVLAKRLEGVDLSGGMLAHARKRKIYDELHEAELTAFLADRPAKWDAIVSADVLVYFGELDAVIGGFARSLRPGGHLVFTTERTEETDAPKGYRIHPHGRYSHTERYVRETLEAAGFTVRRLDAAHLRLEGGEPVHGTLAVATLVPA